MLKERIQNINNLIGEIPDLDILSWINTLTKDYGELEVAKECYNFDKNYAVPLYYFALLGNKYSEKYLRLCIENNPNDEDNIFYANIGLMALGIDEGFKVIEEFLKRTHPLCTEDTSIVDIYQSILPIKSKKVYKILDDIENGKYSNVNTRDKEAYQSMRREYEK